MFTSSFMESAPERTKSRIPARTTGSELPRAQPRRYVVSLGALALALLGCSDSRDPVVDAGEPSDERPFIDAQGCRPDADFLLGGGRSVLPCRGECTFELALSSVILLGAGECTGFRATLSVAGEFNRPLYTVRADLTDQAWDRAAVLASRLRTESLADSYGCPQCSERGTAWVDTRAPAAEARRHRYPLDEATPAQLSAANEFLRALIDQLRDCRGPAIAACTRVPSN